jgi:hypothetical protein
VVLQVVAFVMGVDDIDGQLEALATDMAAAAETTTGTQALNSQTSASVASMAEQSEQVQADAEAAIAAGTEAYAGIEELQSQLISEDEALLAAAFEAEAYAQCFADEYGEELLQTALLDPEVVAAFTEAADGLAAWIEAEEADRTAMKEEAAAAVSADAAAAGLDASPWLGELDSEYSAYAQRNTDRMSALSGVGSELSGLPADATSELSGVTDSLVAVADDAWQDADAYSVGLADWLAAVSLELVASESLPDSEEPVEEDAYGESSTESESEEYAEDDVYGECPVD